MPRHHKRTSTRGGWLQSDMERAVEEVRKGIYPLNKDAIPEIAYAPSVTTHRDSQAHNEGISMTGVLQTQGDLVSAVSGPDNHDESDRSFEAILPFPKAPPRTKPPRKKSIETGIRVLTSNAYRKELSEVQSNSGSSKTQNKSKVNKEKKKVQIEMDNDNSDNVCAFCDGNFYEDNEEEGWIQCQVCSRWFHEICAGVYGKSVVRFICEDCKM